MVIREEKINESSLAALDAYSSSCHPCQLLQSSAWLRFQEQTGKTPRLFSCEHNDQQIFFSAFEYSLPLKKKYLYIPRGPFVGHEILWKLLLEELKKVLDPKEYMFVRFEPDSSGGIPAFAGMSVKRVLDVQPSHTFYTELQQDEKELFAAMHPKTRYNIRLALKKEMSFLYNDTDSDSFISLMKETSARDGFSSHAADYYKKMVESGVARLATIKDSGELLAAGIFAQFGDTMTYLHGASSSNKRELMAPYALHWEMMMFAKGQGLKHYDWHGVDSNKWPGFTRFKRGFGGHDIIYPGTFDLILDRASYLGYTVVRRMRRLF
jgi:lipid II:glycine glycyltransferase (peptidoglycan interpeptide bridge formation enzyme)